MSETISVPAPIRDITRLIAEQENGDFSADISAALLDLLADMEELRMDQRGKPQGAVTITLNFTNDEGVIEIKADFKVTKPKKKRPKSIYWLTDNNQLSRQNPRQMDMGFRDVNRPSRAIVEA